MELCFRIVPVNEAHSREEVKSIMHPHLTAVNKTGSLWSSAGFVGQGQGGFFVSLRGGRRIQLQLLLAAECGNPAAVGLKVSLRGVKSFLSLIQVFANRFELVLEMIERLLCLSQLQTALLEAAGDFVPLVYQCDRLQGHQQRVG